MAYIVCDFEVEVSAVQDYTWALDAALPGKTREEKKMTWEKVHTCLAYALQREGMKGEKAIENQLLLKRLSSWLQAVQPESPSGGLAASASEEHFSVEVCLCKHELQGWVQVCRDATDISVELKASAEHVSALCGLLRSKHRDRETYWCAEAVLLLRQTEKEWTTRRAQI